LLGIGLDQREGVVLVAEIEVSIRVKDGSRAAAGLLCLPHNFPGLCFDAGRGALPVAVSAIDVVAEADESAVMVLEGRGVEEIDLLGGNAIALWRQLEQGAAGAVGGRTEDIVGEDNGRRDICGSVSYFVVAPKEAAILRSDTYKPLVGQLDVLLYAGGIGGDD